LKVILTGTGADEFAGGYSTSFTRPRKNWQEYVGGHVSSCWKHFMQLEDEQTDHFYSNSVLQQQRSSRSGYQHMMYMNLSSLQFYNLWHEDRTSSSQGIEARVPFLDHRLIEFLASVPPVYFEELFWNKRIVRDQLSRLLPNYAVDFPKVPFLDVPCNNSIQVLKVEILRRTFRDFREKYAKPAGATLPAAQIDRLYQVAVSGSHEANRAIQMLLQIMQIEIFRQVCLEDWRTPPSISAASPLKEGFV
jgi:asparagine synthase (glutamine-hydrolysing)